MKKKILIKYWGKYYKKDLKIRSNLNLNSKIFKVI